MIMASEIQPIASIQLGKFSITVHKGCETMTS